MLKVISIILNEQINILITEEDFDFVILTEKNIIGTAIIISVISNFLFCVFNLKIILKLKFATTAIISVESLSAFALINN